jgi:hypothetical protein
MSGLTNGERNGRAIFTLVTAALLSHIYDRE